MKYQQGDVLFNEVSNTHEIVMQKERTYKYGNTPSKETGPKLSVAEKLKAGQSDNYRTASFINDEAQMNCDNDVTVALGEVTGHSHTFYATDNNKALITSFGKNNMGAVGREVPDYVSIANANAVIKHEEHDPISLPQGLYKVRIVREFDHLTQRTRNVVD